MSTGRFALFADCLLLGLLTAVCALPIITAYPAFVAACTLLRDDKPLAGYLAQLVRIIRTGPAVLVVPPLAAGILALDAIAVMAGVPGSLAVALLLVTACIAGVVVGLRAAVRWRPEVTWSRLIRAAARDSLADPGGSALLALAFVAALAIAVLVPLTLLVIGGMLALAAVGVDTIRYKPGEV